MTELEDALASLLTELDEPTTKLSEREISRRAHSLIEDLPEEQRQQVPTDLLAEHMAFTFQEDYSSESTGWGTYYGPLAVMKNEQGEWFEWPSIQKVSKEILDYWTLRADTAQHPLLRIRYADLVWDLSYRAGKTRPPHRMAQIAIDSTTEYIDSKVWEDPVGAATKLRRALSLALSLSDEERLQRLVNLFLRFDGSAAVEDSPSVWTSTYDALMHPKLSLSEIESETIVARTEDRLSKTAERKSAKFDPFGAKELALRLERHYRKKGRPADAERVLLAFADAFVAAAEGASGLVASGWLKDVYETLQRAGLRDAANRVGQQLRVAQTASRQEMTTISHEAEIPRQELEAFYAALEEGPLEEILPRIALEFLPDREAAESQVRQLAAKAPLFSLFSFSIQDDQGRPEATVGPVHEDLEGRVVFQMARGLDFEAPFLRECFRRLAEAGKLGEGALIDELQKSSLFTPDREPLLRRGVRAFFDSDLMASCSLLVPEIEAALRHLLVGIGGTLYKPSRFGGLLVRSLDEILGDEDVRQVLPERTRHYMRVVLTDHRGWNVRNLMCHGLLPPSAYGYQIADRLLHILIVLSFLREQIPDDSEVEGGD